jgi:threonylcarbamoyladenosine tRNA methylthiotransferase MtaB
MATVAVFTIGCKVNQAESEELRMDLASMGHRIVTDPSLADLCVVNTCTVTAESDRKCRKLIRWLARRGARSIVAAGCYAQIDEDALAGLPGVVEVIPNTRKADWARHLARMLATGDSDATTAKTSHVRGFIKVQDGCERGCSYCIVPLARGGETSRPIHDVLDSVKRWLETGTSELVLCGINLGRYSVEGYDLAGLISEVLSVGGGFRVRLSSIEPEDLRLEWLREWSTCPRVCPHLHLPLQSGDSHILRDMGRGYSPQDYIEAAGALRSIWPAAALTTEVMVGYPGESEAAFNHTLEVLGEVRPARMHVFRFSPRPGTKLWGRGKETAHQEAERRSSRLRSLAEEWRLSYIEERIGEIRGMLVENILQRNGEAVAMGTTEDYIKAILPQPPQVARAGCVQEAGIIGLRSGRALMGVAVP